MGKTKKVSKNSKTEKQFSYKSFDKEVIEEEAKNKLKNNLKKYKFEESDEDTIPVKLEGYNPQTGEVDIFKFQIIFDHDFGEGECSVEFGDALLEFDRWINKVKSGEEITSDDGYWNLNIVLIHFIGKKGYEHLVNGFIAFRNTIESIRRIKLDPESLRIVKQRNFVGMARIFVNELKKRLEKEPFENEYFHGVHTFEWQALSRTILFLQEARCNVFNVKDLLKSARKLRNDMEVERKIVLFNHFAMVNLPTLMDPTKKLMRCCHPTKWKKKRHPLLEFILNDMY